MDNKRLSTNTHKILIIDDDPNATRLLSMMVEQGGYQAITAHVGHEGVALAQQEMPDLILCDVMMPDANGYDVLQALQNHSSTATIPFIFLTARARQEDMREGMELGADDYLTKPVRANTLLSAISTRLQRHQALQADRLAVFSQRLVLSQEHHRQQMAYVLDNDVNQLLRSLQFIFNLLDVPTDVSLYNEAKAQLGNLIQRVDGLTQELHPTMLGRLGLVPAIRWLAEQYELAIELEFENLDYKFDPQVEVCVFRLVQESLNNISQHAQTDQAKVVLKYVAPYLEVTVEDKGVGFDLEQTLQSDQSMGLQYMEGLVAWLNGELHIASRPNEGTSIYALLTQTTAEPAVRQSASKKFLRLASRPQWSEKPAAGAVKILLAMEQSLQLQGMKKLLDANSQFQVVGETYNLTEVVPVMEKQKPQLLIIDPVTESKNQPEILQTITTASPQTAVLVISTATHDEYVRAAFESGVLGYIPNTATITDLHTAIMRVAQKKFYVSPTLTFDLARWQAEQTV
jgi:DNA-binding NarL/FixJ family response regulator/two-component sensor histidine kinase